MPNLYSILFRAYGYEQIREVKRDMARIAEALIWQKVRELDYENLPRSYSEMLALRRFHGAAEEDPRCIRRGPVFGAMIVIAATADCTRCDLDSHISIAN